MRLHNSACHNEGRFFGYVAKSNMGIVYSVTKTTEKKNEFQPILQTRVQPAQVKKNNAKVKRVIVNDNAEGKKRGRKRKIDIDSNHSQVNDDGAPSKGNMNEKEEEQISIFDEIFEDSDSNNSNE